MIQYIIAAGIGAFLGSRSKKSKKSYAHGGEVVEDSDGNKYEIIEDYSDFKLGELGYNPLSGVVIPTDEEDIEMANENWHKVKKFSYAEGGEIESYNEFISREDEYLDNIWDNEDSEDFKIHKRVEQLMKKDNKWHPDYRGYVDKTYYKYYTIAKKNTTYAEGGEIEADLKSIKNKYPNAKVSYYFAKNNNGKSYVVTAKEKGKIVYSSYKQPYAKGGEISQKELNKYLSSHSEMFNDNAQTITKKDVINVINLSKNSDKKYWVKDMNTRYSYYIFKGNLRLNNGTGGIFSTSITSSNTLKDEHKFKIKEKDLYDWEKELDPNKERVGWESIIYKFGEVYYSEGTNNNELVSDQVKAEEYKWQFDRYSKYASSLSWADAEDKFKKSLTADELNSIEISYSKEEYADLEEHDTEKYHKQIVVKLKKYEKGGSTYQGGGDIKTLKVGDRIKDKYGYELEVYQVENNKIHAQAPSGSTHTYYQKDFDNGEVELFWSNKTYQGGGEITLKNFKYDPSIDYFSEYTLLPTEVFQAIMKEEYEDPTYKSNEKLLSELKPLGWTFEYGLGADGYSLRPIGEPEQDEYAKGGMTKVGMAYGTMLHPLTIANKLKNMQQLKQRYEQGGKITGNPIERIMPYSQLQSLKEAEKEIASGRREEPLFIDDLNEAYKLVPKIYQQDGKGKNAVVYFHYFIGGSDWYITELDKKTNEAFGYAILNGDTEMSEFGYININEFTENNKAFIFLNIDQFFKPKTLNQIFQSKYPELVSGNIEIYEGVGDKGDGVVATSDYLNLTYGNPYERNIVIRSLIDEKGNNANNYTIDEKEFIQLYSGMGGLEKYGASNGLLYEYYTPKDIVEKMWGLAFKHKLGTQVIEKVLEPSVGIGNFVGYAPKGVIIDGYDTDKYAFSICKIIYDDSKHEFYNHSFEKQFITDKNKSVGSNVNPFYDLVIGNPPYGSYSGLYAGMGEKKYTQASDYIDYFIFRSLDLLKSGGLLVFIVGKTTQLGGKRWTDQMKTPNKAQTYIRNNSDLVDAYRLPVGVFETTNVESEIIVLRKK